MPANDDLSTREHQLRRESQARGLRKDLQRMLKLGDPKAKAADELLPFVDSLLELLKNELAVIRLTRRIEAFEDEISGPISGYVFGTGLAKPNKARRENRAAKISQIRENLLANGSLLIRLLRQVGHPNASCFGDLLKAKRTGGPKKGIDPRKQQVMTLILAHPQHTVRQHCEAMDSLVARNTTPTMPIAKNKLRPLDSWKKKTWVEAYDDVLGSQGAVKTWFTEIRKSVGL